MGRFGSSVFCNRKYYKPTVIPFRISCKILTQLPGVPIKQSILQITYRCVYIIHCSHTITTDTVLLEHGKRVPHFPGLPLHTSVIPHAVSSVGRHTPVPHSAYRLSLYTQALSVVEPELSSEISPLQLNTEIWGLRYGVPMVFS